MNMKSNQLKSSVAAAPMRRRSFLKGVLATGAVSIFTPRSLFAADGSVAAAGTGKINLACVGILERQTETVLSTQHEEA